MLSNMEPQNAHFRFKETRACHFAGTSDFTDPGVLTFRLSAAPAPDEGSRFGSITGAVLHYALAVVTNQVHTACAHTAKMSVPAKK